jgi:hypothetical protein
VKEKSICHDHVRYGLSHDSMHRVPQRRHNRFDAKIKGNTHERGENHGVLQENEVKSSSESSNKRVNSDPKPLST